MPASTFEQTCLSSRDPDEIGLLIAGETNIQNRDDPATAFDGVRSVFERADIRFCHLEGLLCLPSDDPARPDIPHKLLWRHSGPGMVGALTSVGIDAVSCASNVSYPSHAVMDSAAVLTNAGIACAGIGASETEARTPAIVDCRGTRVAFLSYTSVFWPSEHAATQDRPGTAVLPARTAYSPGRRALEMPGAPPEVITFVDQDVCDGLRADVRAAKAKADIVILSCHWGVSSSPDPVAYQTALAQTAIEAGADAVIGHHPHVLQPIAFHQGKPIFYGVGNFVFDWPKMRGRNLDGLLLRLDLSGGFVKRIRFVPVQRGADNELGLRDPNSAEGSAIVEHLRNLCSESAELRVGETDIEVCTM